MSFNFGLKKMTLSEGPQRETATEIVRDLTLRWLYIENRKDYEPSRSHRPTGMELAHIISSITSKYLQPGGEPDEQTDLTPPM